MGNTSSSEDGHGSHKASPQLAAAHAAQQASQPASPADAIPQISHSFDQMDIDQPADAAPARPQLRRKSTILLGQEEEQLAGLQGGAAGGANTGHNALKGLEGFSRESDDVTLSRANSGEEIQLPEGPPQGASTRDGAGGKLYEITLNWSQGGHRVYVTGSFTGWRKMIQLMWDPSTAKFTTTIRLTEGTHKMRFVVDNELRCSDYLPTATDSMGNLVNYIEVADPKQAENLVEIDDEYGHDKQFTRYEQEEETTPVYEYSSEIPQVFTDSLVMDKFISSSFVTPPQLPPQLEGVILNTDSQSELPIPNHVVLNHLATASIKHNTLAVASISRYSGKYVTQILYAPL